MNYYRRTLFHLFASLLCTLTAHSQFVESVAHSEYITYTIQREDNNYTVTEKNSVVRNFLKEPDEGEKYYVIAQSPYDTIVDVEARIGKEEIEDVYIENINDDDLFLNDNYHHIVKFTSVSVKKNDILKVSYERHYKDIAFVLPVPIGNYDSLGKIYLEFIHPADIRVDFDFWTPTGKKLNPVIKSNPEQTTLMLSDIVHQKSFLYFPFDYTHGIIFISIKEKTKELVPRNVNNFVNWYAGLLEKVPRLKSDEVHFLEDEVHRARSEYEKVKIIYDWVRSNVRYIAEEEDYGAIIPRKPSNVIKRKFGDCKDKAFLISDIARLFGIKVSIALIHMGEHTYFFDDKVATTQFNHAICHAILDGKELFFDPTSTYTQFGSLPESDIGRTALVVDRDKPLLVKATDFKYSTPSMEVYLSTKLSEKLEATGTVILRNSLLSNISNWLEINNTQDLNKYILRLLNWEFSKIKWHSPNLKIHNKNEAVFEVHASLKDYIVTSANKYYIPQIPYSIKDADVLNRQSDDLPVFFVYTHDYVFSLSVDHKLLTVKPVEDLKIGEYKTGYLESALKKENESTVVLNSRWRLDSKFFEKENKTKLCESMQKILDNKKKFYIFTKE